MKTFSADLIALLASGVPMWKVDLFAIGPLLNGSFIYACNADGPIIFGGNSYQPATFGSWQRDSIVVKIGLDSNSTRLTVFCDNDNATVFFPGTSQGCLMLDGIKFGLLGMAPVTIYTSYAPKSGPFGVTVGSTGGSLVETKFVGQVANVEQVGLTKGVIAVQDMLYLLNIQVPRMIFQASCSNVLYDPKCTLNSAAFTRNNSVGTVTNSYTFAPTSNLTTISAAGTFTQGTLRWTSGKNAGLAYFVRLWTPGGAHDSIQLDVAPIFPIAATDAFSITEGCDKTFVSCTNLQGSTTAPKNFSGQPLVPVPETAL